jgi:pimeloyl-ACP methyl ester carboxylesterase
MQMVRSFSTYLPENVQALPFESDDQRDQVMGEVRELVIFEANNGQQISGIYANRGEHKKSPLVRINSMFGASDRLDQQYIVAQAALRFRDRSIIQFDLPAHGESEPLTPEQVHEIREHGTTSLIGRSRAEALHKHLPSLSSFNT